MGLSVADKPDSQEICFIPDNDYRSFVTRRVPEAARHGTVVDERGHVVGAHAGIHRFTVGQRKGLDLAAPTGTSRRRRKEWARACVAADRLIVGVVMLMTLCLGRWPPA